MDHDVDDKMGYDIDNDDDRENVVINKAKDLLDFHCKCPTSPFGQRVSAGLMRNYLEVGNPLDPKNAKLGKKFWSKELP